MVVRTVKLPGTDGMNPAETGRALARLGDLQCETHGQRVDLGNGLASAGDLVVGISGCCDAVLNAAEKRLLNDAEIQDSRWESDRKSMRFELARQGIETPFRISSKALERFDSTADAFEREGARRVFDAHHAKILRLALKLIHEQRTNADGAVPILAEDVERFMRG